MPVPSFLRLHARARRAFTTVDYDLETRRRMSLSVAWRLLALSPPFLALYFWLDLPTAAWSVAVASTLDLVALIQISRRRQIVAWNWVIVLGMSAVIFVTLYVGGGLRSPGAAWLLLGPLLGCYFFGFAGAMVTALLTLATLTGYAIWEEVRGPIPHQVPPELQNAWNFLIIATAVLATLAITNAWMAMLRQQRQRQDDAERAFAKALGSLAEAVFVFETHRGQRGVQARQENPTAAQLRAGLEESGFGLAQLMGVDELDAEALNGLSYVSSEKAIQVRHPVSGATYEARVTSSQDGFVLCLSDISMHVEIEQQLRRASHEALEASRLKSEFLATMSHEIRTPMNGVLGMTELAMQGELSAEQRDCLNTVHECAESLLVLINDILDLSKIEAGRIELESVPFDLLEVLEGVQDGLSARAAHKRLDWHACARPDVPTRVVGDPLRLRQVLLNLASNAIKFTEQGSVTMEVSLLELDAAAGSARLRFEVRDTGIGVSEDARQRLFQKFMQADSSTTRRYGGTGLGLAISRQLVQLMGGELDLQSEVGRGSNFFFEVSLGLDPAAHEQPDDQHLLVGRRVLVVDDVEVNRRIFAGQARRLGCRYEVAADGDEALRALDEAVVEGDPFFCVWVDQCMPKVTGMELGREIRKDPKHDETWLILLSSFQDLGDGSKAIEAGFQAWTAKPVKLSALREEMSRMARSARPTLPPHLRAAGAAPARAAASGAPMPAPAVSARKAPAARERVLLAEDNPVNRKLALKMLERLGFQADVATDGRQALAMVSEGRYDLVLMDCQMPEMDGYEASSSIRRLGGDAAKLPIIALTANAMVGDREKCLAAGMSDYLSKPLRQDEFLAMLERWLGRPIAPIA